MCAWEVLITKGQEWDWLGDPFGKVQTLLLIFVLGGAVLVVWEMRRNNPVVNFRPLGERNLWVCSVIIFCAYAELYAASTSLPGLLQSLFGYDAYHSGLVMSPSGFASVTMLLVCGALLGRGTDARWLIGGGLLVVAAGGYWMSVMNLEISPWQAILPRVVLIAGLGMAFAPLNVAAFLYTPRHLRRGRGTVRLAPQRGGQLRHVDGPDRAGTPRSAPHVARGGISRSLQLHRRFLPGAGPGVLFPANRGCAESGTDGTPKAGGPAGTASGVSGLLRRFPRVRRPGGGARLLVLLMKRSVAGKGEHIGAE